MEVKDTEKTVISKPVACRPGLSNLKSFSELLSGAVSASSPAAFSESAVAVIRPRTVRFKPVYNIDSVGADIFSSAAGNPTKVVPESNVVSNVIYKPIAKLVSKATVSLLANLGDHGINSIRGTAEVVSSIQANQVNHQIGLTSDSPIQSEKRKANDTLENHEHEKQKSLLHSSNTDQPCYDGHSWRKYGQKQVKGSEYPRSYYKCTHLNCPVKKKVEKTLDGQIAEIVYKGEHNHSKTKPDAQEPAHDTVGNKLKTPLVTNQEAERVKDDEGRSENQNNITESSAQSTFHGAAPPIIDPLAVAICNASVSASNNSQEEVSESLEAEGDDFKSKRRKRENQLPRTSTVGEPSSEPRGQVQGNTDTLIIGDGFRWRKYGQKVVKGKIYPRSYYRCTSPKCNVRKYVERTSEDPGTFITTYEGKHNHAMPIKGSNAEASKTTSSKNKS